MELARIKRPINRSAIARQNPCGAMSPAMQNPVSVVGGGATVGSGGTGAGISSSPSNVSSQRFFFNNYSPYYWGYSPWWNYYGWWGGYPGAWGWPMGYGFSSPWYWPEWPTQYWPGPYAYQPRYPVVAIA